ncbi:rRNA-binding ribosome biosynthesis protein [Coemansia sp. RSA 1721]|nr:rRNA-binding ribosome biosynthesis protein [Coemansia sp. RSA 1721]
MGHSRKKKRTHVVPTEEEIAKTPRSLVVKSGEVGPSVSRLVRDVRRVMEPFTASSLKERKNNRVKDYVSISSHLGISHLLLFSQTESGTNLRIGRVPRGPTLYFKVNSYALATDCLHLQKSPSTSNIVFKTSPLIILNNFAGEDKGKELKLMTAMLQNMFPAINPSAMHLSDARRVVLFNYNDATGMVDFRHYNITVKPVGVTKGVKRVIMAKDVPSLAGFDDISEYVLREAFASESDVEDGPENSVTLSEDYFGRVNRKNDQRAVRLKELGPRMELCLMKVQGGLCEGDVLYHNYLSKTKEEIAADARKRQIKLTNQARRRQEQEANVKRKNKDKKDADGSGESDSDSDNDEDEDSDGRGGNMDDSDDEIAAVAEKPKKVRLAADDFGADSFDPNEASDSSDGSIDGAAGGEDEDGDVEMEERKPSKRAKTSSKSSSDKKTKTKTKEKNKGKGKEKIKTKSRSGSKRK